MIGRVLGERSKRIEAVVWCVYVALVAFAMVHHEPWRDEADPWLLARDASLGQMFHRMGLSGTPGLWHLILLPFAKSRFPYWTQSVIQGVIVAATAAIILRRAPFPLVTRIALLASYYFSYEYAVIVRSYALSALLLVLVAAWYDERFSHPLRFGILVAFLANANTHSLLIAMFIGAAYVLDGWLEAVPWRTWTRGAAWMLAGGLAAVVQLLPPPDSIATGAVMKYTPNAVALALGNAFFPMLALPATAIGGAIVVLTVLFAVRKNRGVLVIVCGSFLALAWLFTYKWVGGLRHFGFIPLLVVIALWIDLRQNVPTRATRVAIVLLTIVLAIAIVPAAQMVRLDTRYAFSGAKEMAGFIRSHDLDRNVIAAHSETTTSALCPYFSRPFWYLGTQRNGTFTMWDMNFEQGLNVSYPEAVDRFRRRFPPGAAALLLLNVEMPDPASKGFALLYRNQIPIFANQDEHFWLYRRVR